jgi:pimeloyl-ACP methyl ester carboxylesterase
MARSTWADDYPWATPMEALLESGAELVGPHWGEGAMIDVGAPSQADNPESRAFWARLERASASPGMLAKLVLMFFEIDVRDVVTSVHVPTLVLHRQRDRLVNVRNGRWLAEHLPNSRLVELPGDDHIMWYEDVDRTLGEVQEFLTGTRQAPEPRRALATVLFTDIVDSTRTAVELGDQRWRGVLEEHQRAVHSALSTL